MALDRTSMYHCIFSGTTLFSLASSVCRDLRREPRLPDCIAWLMLATASCTEGRREREDRKGEKRDKGEERGEKRVERDERKGEGRGERGEGRGQRVEGRGERGEG